MSPVELLTEPQRTRDALVKARSAVGGSAPLQEYLYAAYLDRVKEAESADKRMGAIERAAEIRLLMLELFSPGALTLPTPPSL